MVSWNTEYWHAAGRTPTSTGCCAPQQADVYLLQEYLRYPGGVPERIDALDRLRAELPGYHIAFTGEMVTLSRYPIVGEHPIGVIDELEPPDTDFPEYWRYKALRTDIRIGDRVMSLYNTHIWTPVWVGGPSVFSAESGTRSTISTPDAGRSGRPWPTTSPATRIPSWSPAT